VKTGPTALVGRPTNELLGGKAKVLCVDMMSVVTTLMERIGKNLLENLSFLSCGP
jgi:hypothetical protein